jgi:hypothetical protein
LPTDIEVLAEDTAQVAAGEEDRPRASPAAEAVLLAVVREMTRYHGIASGPANREFVLQAVDPAITRTARATAEDLDGAVDAALQLTALEQREIGRAESSGRGSGVGQHKDWTPG